MWYNGSSQDLKRIALEVYTEEELTKAELPNNWEEYKKDYPFYSLNTLIDDDYTPDKYIALAKLELLRDCYRQGWKPDWYSNDCKYCIHLFSKRINACSNDYGARFLSFQSSEIRDKFLKNFKDLIEKAGDLI